MRLRLSDEEVIALLICREELEARDFELMAIGESATRCDYMASAEPHQHRKHRHGNERAIKTVVIARNSAFECNPERNLMRMQKILLATNNMTSELPDRQEKIVWVSDFDFS